MKTPTPGTLVITRHFKRLKVEGVSQDCLSPEGRAMGTVCRANYDRLGLVPDRIVVTPLARTGETAGLTFLEIEPITEPGLDYRLLFAGETDEERDANAVIGWGAAANATNLRELLDMLPNGIGHTARATVRDAFNRHILECVAGGGSVIAVFSHGQFSELAVPDEYLGMGFLGEGDMLVIGFTANTETGDVTYNSVKHVPLTPPA